jgi:hypothetical protein
MTVQQQSKLSRLYQQLYQQAERRQGTQRCPLPGGARLAITINGDKVVVSFARQGKRLSDREIETFKAHCCIPPHAKRVPEVGQTERHDGWYVMGYTWEVEL